MKHTHEAFLLRLLHVSLRQPRDRLVCRDVTRWRGEGCEVLDSIERSHHCRLALDAVLEKNWLVFARQQRSFCHGNNDVTLLLATLQQQLSVVQFD